MSTIEIHKLQSLVLQMGEEILNLSQRVSDKIKADDMTPVHMGIQHLAEFCESFSEGATVLAGFLLKNAGPWEAQQEELTTTFSQIVESYEKRDFILVGDLIEYDLSKTMKGLIGQIHEWKPAQNNTQNLVGR